MRTNDVSAFFYTMWACVIPIKCWLHCPSDAQALDVDHEYRDCSFGTRLLQNGATKLRLMTHSVMALSITINDNNTNHNAELFYAQCLLRVLYGQCHYSEYNLC
jgi:heterodisulfide reductase subunit C